ncbi:hypothetical protein [Candidatus Methylacidithermus pantelleriae]|uniref:Uncharacterized protein n=1 Tax=Candidatus Methylacidithermus pantelleriae TaxID=2744239 RepID=A0A8J2BKA4_9BACT|nr:hypothetical protein [Candidatus Methylacidithermus pantelleriae]CAF0692487.1 hypothetical protein MPNT_120034 [Candidatus Methylacidithermus pantelleriae]
MKLLNLLSRPWFIALSLVLFFGASFASGFWVGRASRWKRTVALPGARVHYWANQLTQQLEKGLPLSADQVRKISPIVEEECRRVGVSMHRHFLVERERLWKQLQMRISPLLEPDQRQKFDLWIKRRVETLEKKLKRLPGEPAQGAGSDGAPS